METTSIRDSYTFYRKNYKDKLMNLDYRNGIPIYLDIINGLMKFIVNKMFNGSDVILGAKLGIVGIRGNKVKPKIDENGNIRGMSPDWGATKKYWVENSEAKEKKTLVYCFNEHSGGITYRFCWSKKKVIIENKTFYGLSFTKGNRRELARLVKEENREYILIEKI